MFNKSNVKNRLMLLSTTSLAGAMLMTASALAQDDDAVDQIDDNASVVDDVDDGDRIVVTGSRIRKNSFTSTSPLQTVDAETIADLGLIDIQDVLQNTSVVQGVQLDQQFNSSQVSNAGPGGSAVALRGLGADRTLLLINGRRVAPSGIEGAPSFPDTSILPSSLVQRIDILLDGASSVYGSDAVAGVVNVILRDEFEGVQLDAFRTAPLANSAGTEQRYSFMIGDSGERGSFVVAAEYVHNEELRGNDRDWMRETLFGANSFFGLGANDTLELFGATNFLPQDADGDGISDSLRRELGDAQPSVHQQFAAFPLGAILVPREGAANPFMGLANFESWDGTGAALEGPSLGVNQDQQLLPEFQRFNVFATAKYDLSDWIEGTEAFLEFNMTNRQNSFENTTLSLNATITTDNLFSPLTALGATSNFTLRGLRPFRGRLESELTQYRLYGGLRGDLSFGKLPDWEYELYGGYTRSQGFSQRTGIHEERFIRSLTHVVDSAGVIQCAPLIPNPSSTFAGSLSLEECVPLDLFDPGFFLTPQEALAGEQPRATSARNQAAIDYIKAVRTVDTFVDEAIIGGYFTGPLFDLPAGELQLVLGGEARETQLQSNNDDVASRGLLSGFFSDRASNGDVHLWELFGEVFIPVFKDAPFAQNLELEGSGRYTNHEFYGSNFTYSGKMAYSPVDFLTVRATVGSSFRAPGLRELFLEGQSSFSSVTDPCVVPGLAQADTDGDGQTDSYNPGGDANGDGVPDNDGRLSGSALIIQNCMAEGLDPFALGLGVTPGTAEVFNAGNTGLDPETSFAYSGGISFEQPFTDAFGLRLSASYWAIKITDSVLSPSAQFLVDSCYTSVNFPNDPFCTRRLRDPNDNFLREIDATPFNIAENIARGLDVNMSFDKDFAIGGEQFSFNLDTVTTWTRKLEDTTILPGAPAVVDQDAGDIGSPKWRSTANARLGWNDFTLFYQVRHIGKQVEDIDTRPADCFNPGGGVDLPRCYTVPNVVYHDASLAWRQENFVLRLGVNNLLDKDPPQVDEDLPGVENNGLDNRSVPFGVGYDRIGRRLFFNVTAQF